MRRIEVDLTYGLYEELEMICSELNKDQSQVMMEALKMYLDYYDMEHAVRQTKNPADEPLSADDFYDGLDIE